MDSNVAPQQPVQISTSARNNPGASSITRRLVSLSNQIFCPRLFVLSIPLMYFCCRCLEDVSATGHLSNSYPISVLISQDANPNGIKWTNWDM